MAEQQNAPPKMINQMGHMAYLSILAIVAARPLKRVTTALFVMILTFALNVTHDVAILTKWINWSLTLVEPQNAPTMITLIR